MDDVDGKRHPAPMPWADAFDLLQAYDEAIRPAPSGIEELLLKITRADSHIYMGNFRRGAAGSMAARFLQDHYGWELDHEQDPIKEG